jgi:poly-gamma-glutamate synthesis protein (capsule biosynthesis protein)
LQRDRFYKKYLIFRIAVAVLLSNAWTISAQRLIIPEKLDPANWEVSPLYKQDTVKIRFFGDIMMHTLQIQTADKGEGRFNFSSYYKLMEKYLSDSDLNVGNMEFTLGGEPYTGYPAFSAPDSFAAYLADIGFNIFLCANNHIFDKGRNGLVRTLEIYRKLAESRGIRFTGAAGDETEGEMNNPLIINIKGIRIAFVNATYGTNSYRGEGWPRTNILSDTQTLEEALETAEAKADLTVALVHWGSEYILEHGKSQGLQARWLAENGADIIIGSHPHVVQDAEVIKTKDKVVPVVYSLGNSVSNMSAENTQVGLMTTLQIVRHGNGDIEILDLEHMFTWCSRPGGYGDSYHVLPLTEYVNRKNEWKGKWEYEKMVSTYRRVASLTEIKETTK